MTGQLPQSFTSLASLESLHFDGNAGLCTPLDSSFHTWIQDVDDRQGDNCVPVTPTPPSVLITSFDDDPDDGVSVVLSWTAGTATIYVSQIVRRRQPGVPTWTGIATILASAATWPDTTAVSGERYSYAVRAEKTSGDSNIASSDVKNITVQ